MDRFAAMQAFRGVAELGSFTAVAKRLGQSKSVVSKQIAGLEQQLGVRLLNRTTRRIQLTEAGQRYYERCRQILGELEDLELSMQAVHERPSGQLRVTVPVSFGQRHLAPLLPGFLATHPEISVDVTLDDRHIDLVAGGVDAAVRISDLGDSSLIARRLSSCQGWVCAAPEYLERVGIPREPADLADHNCLIYSYAPHASEWQLTDVNGRRHRVPVTGNLRANNGETLLEAAIQGTGLILIPDFIAADAVNTARLQRVLTDYDAGQLGIYIVYPYTRHVSARLRAFIEYLVDALGSDSGPPWRQHPDR
jgi:DNA-binding transcriptional LysR family regulator